MGGFYLGIMVLKSLDRLFLSKYIYFSKLEIKIMNFILFLIKNNWNWNRNLSKKTMCVIDWNYIYIGLKWISISMKGNIDINFRVKRDFNYCMYHFRSQWWPKCSMEHFILYLSFHCGWCDHPLVLVDYFGPPIRLWVWLMCSLATCAKTLHPRHNSWLYQFNFLVIIFWNIFIVFF